MTPLKAVDTVMKNISVVGMIITGKNGIFISVPFSVKGPLDDAKVTLLPPEAVGGGLWGVLKRTLQPPFEMFKAVISQKESPFFLPQKKANSYNLRRRIMKRAGGGPITAPRGVF
jgi:hypothetical protein